MVTNGIKAITSDFGSENLGSIPGWSTKKPARRAFFERILKRVMGYGQPHKQHQGDQAKGYEAKGWNIALLLSNTL